MANYANLSLWFKDSQPPSLIAHVTKLLSLFPLSEREPGFRGVVIRAVGPAEPSLLERDFIPTADAVGVSMKEFFQSDCALELRAYWELWTYRGQGPQLEWKPTLAPVEFSIHGADYDEGVSERQGHVLLTLGLEHLFTGHAGILGGSGAQLNPEQFSARAEYEFALALQEPEALESYRAHTVENIRRLLAFERALWTGLPLERRRLWSEGEADLERRLEAVLLQRASE